MHKLADLNGEVVTADSARVAAAGAAALVGKGVFTTIAIFNRKPFLLDKHLERLEKNAHTIGISTQSLSFYELSERLLNLITANQVVNGKARLTIFDNGPTITWDTEAKSRVTSLLIMGPFSERKNGLKVMVSPFLLNSTSPLKGIKSCNYLEQTMTLRSARVLGYDEAVRLNERGEVASGSMANIFWVRDGQLYTPSLNTGCLAGTTRGYIIENKECVETEDPHKQLVDAEAIYLTSSGLGIARVVEFDGRRLPDVKNEVENLWPQYSADIRLTE
jgi:branched-subunit amino acid aminotransferase/4-amino-4-deoxychorismate lyase